MQRQVLAKLVEMDEKITLSEQMEEKNIVPVILINKFNVKPEDVDGFPRAWAAEAEIMKRAAWVHFHTASSRDCRELCIHQLCNLGVYRTL